jgi:hypothetical protein
MKSISSGAIAKMKVGEPRIKATDQGKNSRPKGVAHTGIDSCSDQLVCFHTGDITFTPQTGQQATGIPAGAQNQAQQKNPRGQSRQVKKRVDEQCMKPAQIQPDTQRAAAD